MMGVICRFGLLGILLLVSWCNDGNGKKPADGGGGGCKSDIDCRANETCKDGTCAPIGSKCTRMTEQKDCGEKEFCNEVTGKCELKPCYGLECSSGAECGFGEFCDLGVCRAVQNCEDDSACAGGFFCDTAMHMCKCYSGCMSDRDCAENEKCDLGIRKCKKVEGPKCVGMDGGPPCPEGRYCQPEDGECVECLDDSHCGAGLFCNTKYWVCAGRDACFRDDECESPKVCNLATRQCINPVAACQSSSECPRNFACNVAAGRCEPSYCGDDVLEPNQTAGEAKPVGAGVMENLSLCDRDEDWFSIEVPAGKTLEVRISDSFLIELRKEAGGPTLARGSPVARFEAQEAIVCLIRIWSPVLTGPYQMAVEVKN